MGCTFAGSISDAPAKFVREVLMAFSSAMELVYVVVRLKCKKQSK